MDGQWDGHFLLSQRAGLAVAFGSQAAANNIVDLGASDRTVGTINFVSTTGTTIQSSSGNHLVLDNSGTTATITVAGQHAINAGMLLNSDAAITVTGGLDHLTLGGIVADGSASHGITLSGAGTLELAAANTYSGNTSVASGTLLLSNSLALQNSTLTSGGIAFNASVVSHAFAVGGLSGSGGLALADNAGNPVSLCVGSNNSATTYSGVLSGGGSLTLVGSGMLTLGSATTFTGNTLVNGGTLALGNASALQDSALDTSGSGTLSFVRNSLLWAVSPAAAASAPAAPKPVSLSVGNNGLNSTYAGAIGGNAQPDQDRRRHLALVGNNSYSGTTAVSGGVLQFQGNNSLSASSPVAITSGTLQIHNDGSGSNGTIDSPANITISPATTADNRRGKQRQPNVGNTVAFGVLSNGTPANALTSTIKFTASNGYLQSYAGLNLSGGGGGTTTLNPTTTSVIITGSVTNQEGSGSSRIRWISTARARAT